MGIGADFGAEKQNRDSNFIVVTMTKNLSAEASTENRDGILDWVCEMPWKIGRRTVVTP